MAFNDTTTTDYANTNYSDAGTRDFTGRTTVAGLFNDREQARQAVNDLKNAGFSDDQIGIAARDRNDQNELIADTGTHGTTEAATKGAVGGGILGGLVGLLVGLGALAIPGIGPVVAGGVLAHTFGIAAGTTIAGAGIGAVGGGILGALTHLGIPEHEARHFETGFNQGGTLVTVTAGPRSAEAIDILERDGGDTGASLYGTPDVTTGTNYANAAATATPAYTDTTPRTPAYNDTDQTVQLREEQLSARTQPVQAGEVVIRKEVITETKSIDVPVTREEVVIERHAVTGGTATAGSINDMGATEVIRVPVMEEEVIVDKRPVVTEEVSIGKRQVVETQHVTDTVRREEARIENANNVDVVNRSNAAIGSEVDADEVDTTTRANR